MASLPNYRLNKFQPLMPDWVQREVVAGYLLDVARAGLGCANAGFILRCAVRGLDNPAVADPSLHRLSHWSPWGC